MTHLSKATIVSSIAAVAIVAGALIYWTTTHRAAPAEQQVAPVVVAPTTLDATLYPLYPGTSWSPVAHAMIEDLNGYEATSSAARDTSDITTAVDPFAQYYKDKLTAAGWTEDISREAGGPGSDITAYKKGDAYVIVSYATLFKAGGANEPEQCPCDVTLTLFSTNKGE